MFDFDRDLLGDPIRSGHGRKGRPTHLATDDSREMVRVLVRLGWPRDRIAAALDVTEPTVRRWYRRELSS